VPDWIQRRISTCSVVPSKVRKTIQDSKADRNKSPVATHWAACSPIIFQPKPAMMAPTSGAKRRMVSMSP